MEVFSSKNHYYYKTAVYEHSKVLYAIVDSSYNSHDIVCTSANLDTINRKLEKIVKQSGMIKIS